MNVPLSTDQQAEIDGRAGLRRRPCGRSRRRWRICFRRCRCSITAVRVDYMGDDAALIQAARVSYGRGTKKVSEDRGLIISCGIAIRRRSGSWSSTT